MRCRWIVKRHSDFVKIWLIWQAFHSSRLERCLLAIVGSIVAVWPYQLGRINEQGALFSARSRKIRDRIRRNKVEIQRRKVCRLCSRTESPEPTIATLWRHCYPCSRRILGMQVNIITTLEISSRSLEMRTGGPCTDGDRESPSSLVGFRKLWNLRIRTFATTIRGSIRHE